MTDRHPELEALDALISATWAELLARPMAATFLQSPASADRRMLALYFVQAYHYTSHTSRNQALVGVNPRTTNVHYLRYVFEHALEETGHELMALHDLRALGLAIEDPARDMPPPLPETEVLIAYLYYVASHGNPVQRLGYSYWAETAYGVGQSFLEGITARMNLRRDQLTFFHVHAEIDAKHAGDVERALLKACQTPEDWRAVRRAAETSLRLNWAMIEAEFREWERLDRGEPSDYTALNALVEVAR
ncbi:MAG: iron-containing redox enzyme family protein [Planctomycetota bacterium]